MVGPEPTPAGQDALVTTGMRGMNWLCGFLGASALSFPLLAGHQGRCTWGVGCVELVRPEVETPDAVSVGAPANPY